MTKFRILVCDDNPTDQNHIALHIEAVNRNLLDYDIEKEVVDFKSVNDKLKMNFDLLILDLLDSVSDSSGQNVLLFNNEYNKIPTLIYSRAGDSTGFDYQSEKKKYPFLVKKIVKVLSSPDNLKQFIEGYIIVNNESNYYKLYNTNDTVLQLSIQNIGEEHFKYILYQYHKVENSDIVVFPMTPGWSGAVLFKLQLGNSYSILKLSKNISSLKEELENARSLNKKFPVHLMNKVEPKEYYSFDNSVFGFSIKYVDNPRTLLNFIIDINTPKNEIEKLLHKLYLEPDSLKDHYESKIERISDWTTIFETINEAKLSWINESYDDLKSVIEKHYTSPIVDDLRRVAIENKFNNLDKNKLLGKTFQKELVLSHGDFHAKNVIIQSDFRPLIIDTGALGYKHWSLDLTRLITSIFILGLDKNTFHFYDINSIENHLDIGDNIINTKETELKNIKNQCNANLITAINWLLMNMRDIYQSHFSEFEYQLGLCKEFMQIAYRKDTIPPNKRALALILAHKSLLSANKAIN